MEDNQEIQELLKWKGPSIYFKLIRPGKRLSEVNGTYYIMVYICIERLGAGGVWRRMPTRTLFFLV
jgi:hypothetical protein